MALKFFWAHVVVPRFMRRYATYLVGGPGHEGVRALLAHIPAVRPTHPHKPVAGLLDVSRMPSLAAVNAHLTWSMTPTSDAPPRACPSGPATAGIWHPGAISKVSRAGTKPQAKRPLTRLAAGGLRLPGPLVVGRGVETGRTRDTSAHNLLATVSVIAIITDKLEFLTSNRHRKSPRCRRRTCPRYGPGWKMVRSFASHAMISSDIRRKSPIVPVLQQRDRHPTAIPSISRLAFRSWVTTVLHALKLSRRTSSKRPGGPIATCR